MAGRIRILLLASLICLSPAALADAQQEIKHALDYFSEMWNEGDFDALSAYYHQDFILISEQGPIRHGERLGDIKEIFGGDQDRGEMEYSNVTVKALGDKHAVAWGQLKLTFKDGSSLEEYFSTTYVNTPFGWKALLTHN